MLSVLFKGMGRCRTRRKLEESFTYGNAIRGGHTQSATAPQELIGILHTTNGGSHGSKLVGKMLVASVHMINALDTRFASGRKCRQHQCRSGPEIGSHDRRSGKRTPAAHHGG